MKSTLIEIYQRRMDRSQSEQIWAIAIHGAVCAFIISHHPLFLQAIDRCHLLWFVGIISVLTLVFTIERLVGYYNYKNQIAGYLRDEDVADQFIKSRSSAGSANGVIWLLVFLIAVAVPYAALAKITALKNEPNKAMVPTPVNLRGTS